MSRASNACQYCYGVHKETAKAFGVDEALIEVLLLDLEHAPLDARLKPIPAYARVLTLTPAKALQESGYAPLLALLPGGEPLEPVNRCGHRATMGGTPNTPRQPTPC